MHLMGLILKENGGCVADENVGKGTYSMHGERRATPESSIVLLCICV